MECAAFPEGSAGVAGETLATSGIVYGLSGISNSGNVNAAGVFGTSPQGIGVFGKTSASCGGCFGVVGIANAKPSVGADFIPAGIAGFSTGNLGVAGASDFLAVAGRRSGASPNPEGYLGYSTYAVYAFGNYGGTGAKYFIEPHPVDASKVIKYIALEGPEAGTYFRGTARTRGGVAVIDVPESFRYVTDEEGLTVQLTAVALRRPCM